MASNVRHSVITGDGVVNTGPCTLFGWSFGENAGAVAVVNIYDAGSATGTPVARVELALDGSHTAWFGPQGIRMNTGIFVDETGDVSGSVFWG